VRSISVDPVCGMPVLADAAAVVQFREKEYRLCSVACERKFRSDPERYLPERERRPQ
jgi:Cu+-exporting ATPase